MKLNILNEVLENINLNDMIQKDSLGGANTLGEGKSMKNFLVKLFLLTTIMTTQTNRGTFEYFEFNDIQNNYNGYHLKHGSNVYFEEKKIIKESNNIINYDYASSSVFDDVAIKGINDNDDSFNNNYHYYPDIGLYAKQTIMETSVDDEFNVIMDIIQEERNIHSPIDIIFIIDKSESMNTFISDYSRYDLVKNSIYDFCNDVLGENNNVQVAIMSYGSDSFENRTNALYAHVAHFSNSTNPIYFTRDKEKISSKQNSVLYDSPKAYSGSAPFVGIESALNIMEQYSIEESEKYIVNISDNIATFGPGSSYSSIENVYKTTNSNRTRFFMAKARNYFIGERSIDDDMIDLIVNENVNHINKVKEKYEHIDNLNILNFNISNDNFDSKYHNLLNKLNHAIASVENNYYLNSESDFISTFTLLKDLMYSDENNVSNNEFQSEISQYVTLDKESVRAVNLNVVLGDDHYNIYEHSIIEDIDVTKNKIIINDFELDAKYKNRKGIRLTYKVKLLDEYKTNTFYPINDYVNVTVNNIDKEISVGSVKNESFDFYIKVIGLSGYPLDNVNFTLLKDGEHYMDYESSEFGIVNFAYLPVGSYSLILKDQLVGYQIPNSLDFEVRLVNGELKVLNLDHLLVDDVYTYKLLLNNLNLSISFTDQYRNLIDELSFNVSSDNDEIVVDSNNSMIKISNMSVKKYILADLSYNDYYVKLDNINIEVFDDGMVMVDNDLYAMNLDEDLNYLHIQITKDIRTILPETGSNSLKYTYFMLMIISILFLVCLLYYFKM